MGAFFGDEELVEGLGRDSLSGCHREGSVRRRRRWGELRPTPASDGRALILSASWAPVGAWKLVVAVPEIAPKDEILGAEQDGFVLDGITRTGDPARLEVWGHDGEESLCPVAKKGSRQRVLVC